MKRREFITHISTATLASVIPLKVFSLTTDENTVKLDQQFILKGFDDE